MYARFGLALFVLVSGVSCSQPHSTTPNVTYATNSDTSSSTESFDWRLATTKGDIVIRVYPDWAPRGAARVRELTEIGFYNDCAFFRVGAGFVAQFGMSGDPSVQAKWGDANIEDDRPVQSNLPGYVTFASQMRPGTRSTQLFINLGDNRSLDSKGFAPIGRVVEGMDIAEQLFSGYGANQGGPDQGRMRYEGNSYLRESFPKLDYVKTATIENERT
jgi:peptidyl-prolyl cis-trans isomerase A (cyclophilin A)